MEHVSSVRPTGKFPEKVENIKRWSRFPGWNFRTECRVPLTFLVVCTSCRSTIGHPATYRGLRPNGTTFYRSEIPLLLPPKFPSFFRKWKAPLGHSRAWVQLVVVRSMHHIQGSSPHKSWAKSLVGRYVSVLFFKSSRILWNLVRSPLSPTRFLNYLGTWMLYRPGNRSKYFNLKSYSDLRVSTRGHVQHDKPVDGRCKFMIAVFEMLW